MCTKELLKEFKKEQEQLYKHTYETAASVGEAPDYGDLKDCEINLANFIEWLEAREG